MDRSIPKDKSVGAALVLTFFFGPLGLLYSVAWWEALLMLVGAVFGGLFTFGIAAGAFWAASMIWGAVAASSKHGRYCAWLAAQPQTFVAQQSQSPSIDPSPAFAPLQLPPSPSGTGLPTGSAQLSAVPEAVAQPASGLEGSTPNREEEALLGLKRLSELGLITEQEASAKRAEILSRLFPSSSPDDEVTVADSDPAKDDTHFAEETAACARTAELPTMAVPIVLGEGVTEPLAAMSSGTEEQGNGTAPPDSLRRGWLVAAAVAALIAAVALAGTLFVLSRHHRRAASPRPAAALVTPPLTPTASLFGLRLVAVTLPVNVLPTTRGIDGPPPIYAAKVTVQVPRAWAGTMGAYGVAGVVLIAPAGWYGSGGIGADGSESATLHAIGSSAIRGQLTYEFDGAGPATFAAAAYFPWVRQGWSQWGYSGASPVARNGLVEHLTSRHLARYGIVSGPQVDHGLQVNGVARATSDGDWSFDRLEVALPPAEKPLAASILRYYLSPVMNANQGVPSAIASYFDAINSENYETAWQMFSPRFQGTTSLSQFAEGLSTVIDSDPVIHYVKLVNSTTAVAYVTFTSSQDPSQGPNGDSQDNWTLDYRMKRVGWQWLIDYAGPHDGSTHTSG